MTPPDSGETIRCPHGCSSRAACPYCAPHGIVTPLVGSGEREVTVLTADELTELHMLDKGGESAALEWRASVLAAHPFLLAEVERHRVHCPSKDLAQRILAALEAVGEVALADELRANLPKETK